MVGIIITISCIVLTVMTFCAFDKLVTYDSVLSNIAATILLLSSIAFGVVSMLCGISLIVSSSETAKNRRMSELEQQRDAILYLMENDALPGSDFISEVKDYNNRILAGRRWMNSKLLKDFEFDFWYEIEPIYLDIKSHQVDQV